MSRRRADWVCVGTNPDFVWTVPDAGFLTRSTAVLASIFIVLAILLAAIAGVSRKPATIDTSLANQVAPAAPVTAPVVPTPQQPAQQAPANETAPAVPVQQ